MQVVVRALAVLRTLAPRTEGVSLAALAEELSVPTGSMHRLLKVLEAEHFVTRSTSNRRYFLGPAARQLTEENSRRHALLVTPHPALTAAAKATRETVFLTELVGDRAVCVALVESQHPLRMFVGIGQDMPLHAAASARTLLADLESNDVRRLLATRPLQAFTDDTLTEPEDVLEHLALVRARGYDVCDDELDHGVWAIACPVRGSTGRVVASVALAAPAYRVDAHERRRDCQAAVVTAAEAMSADLGWTEPVLPADTDPRQTADSSEGRQPPTKPPRRRANQRRAAGR
jgi:DNA-binding IclR family transcriptional regulator